MLTVIVTLWHVADPWRGDTAHSPAAPNRTDTTIRPFKLIPSKSSCSRQVYGTDADVCVCVLY